VYRPLVVRPEWRGSGIRNAQVDQYAELIAMVRDSFFVVSIADLESNREWIVGPQIIADATYHRGELSFDTMAAIMARAALVYTSSGFPAVLGPAVGTPTISIQGGFEPARWHADGARWAPYLGIDTAVPCVCSGACQQACTKLIDMPRAKAAVAEFVGKLGISASAETRPISEIFAPAQAMPPARPQHIVPPTRTRIGRPTLLARRYHNARA
jgi:ADP-heptose:LPS heptosyltransferase